MEKEQEQEAQKTEEEQEEIVETGEEETEAEEVTEKEGAEQKPPKGKAEEEENVAVSTAYITVSHRHWARSNMLSPMNAIACLYITFI